jgi:hypothetical protein
VNWNAVAPEWIRPHGTVVILLGSDEAPDTVLGNPRAGEKDIKGLSVYLNTRFWDLQKIEVAVAELRSERKTSWPRGPKDPDDSRRPNNRRIMGARYYLTEVKASTGKLTASSWVPLDSNRVVTHWYLWEGERPAIHSYAKKPGYIAVRYGEELFEITTHKAHFRWFGIAEAKVQQNLTIILEPQLFDPQIAPWGIHPDQSRNRLIFTGNGDKGVGLPIADWGYEFAEQMPEEIRAAIRKARGDGPNTLEDEEYRRRLQDKFGDRWHIKQIVQSKAPDPDSQAVDLTDERVRTNGEDLTGTPRHRKRRRPRAVHVIKFRTTDGTTGEGIEREIAVDVPKFRFVGKEEFDNPWHLALWAPNDPDGPTVLINEESPLLIEAIQYQQQQYPDVYAAEVAKIVRTTYGEVAVCKVAHSQKLIAQIPEEELDVSYRSEAALTVALMGLLAEESLIAQRLAKLSRKKSAA